MARFSGATWRPLDSGHQPAMAEHDLVILHTMVGNLTGTDNMFHRNGWTGTESHFGVGGPWSDDKDGIVYQWGDTAYRADANLEANPRAISIETGDNAPQYVKDIKPWTAKQLDAIVDLVTWACKTHNIPAVLVPDSKPSRRGIAYHQLGCEHADGIGSHPGFLVAGGERWSTSLGKECPGPERIAQVKTIIVPRVAARLRGDDDVAELTLNDILGMKFKLNTQFQVDQMNALGGDYKLGDTFTLEQAVLWGGPGQQRLLHELRDVAADGNSLVTALAALDRQVPDDLAAQLAALKAALAAVPTDLTTRLQVISDGVKALQPPTPTGPSRTN